MQTLDLTFTYLLSKTLQLKSLYSSVITWVKMYSSYGVGTAKLVNFSQSDSTKI